MKLKEAFAKRTYGLTGDRSTPKDPRSYVTVATKLVHEKFDAEADLGWVLAQFEARHDSEMSRREIAELYYHGLPPMKEVKNQLDNLEMIADYAEDENETFEDYFKRMLEQL